MGPGRLMARIGLDPGPPVAAPKLFSPMSFHPGRQRILRLDAIGLLGRRSDDEAMRRDLVAAIVVALLDDRLTGLIVRPHFAARFRPFQLLADSLRSAFRRRKDGGRL